MNYYRAVSLVLSALLASSLAAQWWSGNAQVPDEAWRKGKAGFGAMLLLTPDVEKFYEEWRRPETPTIVITKTAYRGKPITAVVVFTGCKARRGNCRIIVDFTVLRPDGTEYGSAKSVAAWVIKPGARKGIVQVSEATLGVVIEPQDPSGEYLVKASVHDRNAKLDLELAQPFTVE